MLLAIDTATKNSSLALFDENGVQAEINWRSHQNHTVELMPQILHILQLARVEKKDLVAIGVALGPGSFSGLRVGMSVAKGLAFVLNIPILGVPTLDAVAVAHSFYVLPMYVIVATGRGRYSVALYHAQAGRAERVGGYALVDANGLIEHVRLTSASSGDDLQSRFLFCGEIDAALAQQFVLKLGERAVIASLASNARRAGFLAELAWVRFSRGESDDVKSLVPMYAPQDAV